MARDLDIRPLTPALGAGFSCRLRWRSCTVAIRDNRDAPHCAGNDYDGKRRCLWRTTIRGSAPLPA